MGHATVPAAKLEDFLMSLGEACAPTYAGDTSPERAERRSRMEAFWLTKALVTASKEFGGAVLGSQLAPLLELDEGARGRHRLIASIRSCIDRASALEPDDAVKGF